MPVTVSVEDLHVMWLSTGELWNNWCNEMGSSLLCKTKIGSFYTFFIQLGSSSRSSKILTLLRGVYELLSAVLTSIIQFGWISAHQVGMSCVAFSWVSYTLAQGRPYLCYGLYEITLRLASWHWMIIWYSLCSALWAHRAVCGALSLMGTPCSVARCLLFCT